MTRRPTPFSLTPPYHPLPLFPDKTFPVAEAYVFGKMNSFIK